MGALEKILKLIPEHWEDVLIRAHQYEAKFNQFEKDLDSRIEVFSSLVEGLLNKLNIDWSVVLTTITNHKVFKKIADVPVDINAWIKLPDDFNGEDPEQVQALISDKVALLKETLSPVQFESFNLDLAVDQLEDILQTIASVPMDMDIDDLQSINEYKNKVLNEVKPKVMVLISTVFNINVAESSIGAGIEKAQSVSDVIAAKMFADQSETESVNQPASQGTEESVDQEESAVDTALNALSKLRSVLPLVQTQLAGKSIAGLKADTVFQLLNDLLDVVEANLEPLVDQITEVQWQDLSLEEGIAQIKASLASVSSIFEESKLGPVFNQLKTSLPIPSSPITWEEFTQEQAWAQFKSIIAKPDEINHWQDVSQLTPSELLGLLKTKFNEAVGLLKHANVFGQNLSQMLDRIIEPFEALTDIPEDHDYSDLKANGRLLLDKILQLGELFIPDVFDDPIAASSQATDNQNPNVSLMANENTDSVEAQTNQAKKQQGNQSLASKVGLTPTNMIRAALVLMKKGQLIYDFLKENNIGLTLKEKQGSAATGQTPATQTDEATSQSETSSEQSSPLSSQPAEGTQPSGTENSAINSKSNGMSNDTTVNTGDIAKEDWLIAIMGNKERGLISQLDNETDQDFLINLINGTLIESTVNTVMTWPEVQSIRSQVKDQLVGMLYKMNLAQDYAGQKNKYSQSNVPTLKCLIKFIIHGFSDLYKGMIELAIKIVRMLIDTIQSLLGSICSLIRMVNIPNDLIPEFIRNLVYSGDELGKKEKIPNILLLIISMPVTYFEFLIGYKI